jgi:four helix bundle protein
MRGAAISIRSNIAEGFERGGDREFLQLLSTAKGLRGEVRSQLYVALDQTYVTPAEFQRPHDESVDVSRLISGFMNYLRQSGLRGNKFKSVRKV